MQPDKLQIMQKLETKDLCSSGHLEGSITLTNVSDLFLNNITLNLSFKNSRILEQLIVRERGALSFDNPDEPLLIGNLAPNESASFYYKLKPEDTNYQFDVIDTIKITYTEENSDHTTEILPDSLRNPIKQG